MTDGKIYPKYSYIMEGSRTENSDVLPESTPRPLANVTTDITGELSKVSYILSDYYKYASYDSYHILHKLGKLFNNNSLRCDRISGNNMRPCKPYTIGEGFIS
jgi:hypothetical protein